MNSQEEELRSLGSDCLCTPLREANSSGLYTGEQGTSVLQRALLGCGALLPSWLTVGDSSKKASGAKKRKATSGSFVVSMSRRKTVFLEMQSAFMSSKGAKDFSKFTSAA